MTPPADNLAMLRELDRDRYLSCLLMPAGARADLSTLFLVNAEIAAIRDRVKEALPGEIRLQWWREALAGERTSEVAAHPFAAQAVEMIARRNLPQAAFERLCEARLFDLYNDPMPGREAYEAYAGETASTLLQLSAMIIDPDRAQSAAEVSGHGGIAQSVAGHLMLLPAHRARGQVYVPGDILAATGLDREVFLAGEDVSGIDAAISAFAALGREHLDHARRELSQLDPSLKPVFLPVAMAQDIFRLAERSGAECLRHAPQPAQWRRQWRLWKASRAGTI